MYDLRFTPADGLHQSADFVLTLTYPAEYGIVTGDHARMQLRPNVPSSEILGTLDTVTGTITVTGVAGSLAQVIVRIPGEMSTLWPTEDTVEGELVTRYRTMDGAELGFTDDGEYLVLPVYGTLIVTGPDDLDRPATLDAELLFKASATRGS